MISIRPYTVTDRKDCIAIFHSNLPQYFDSSELPAFEAFLQQPMGDYLVAEQNGALVGCGGCYVRDGKGRLSWGMISRGHHRAGIGKMLLVWRVNHLFHMPDVTEIAIDTSQHTAGFFAHHGFRTMQQTTNGIGPGIDLVTMSLLRDDWRVRVCQ